MSAQDIYYNIPEEIRLIPSWVLWRMEDIGAAKPTKVPYAISGELANVNDPTTWATFEEAVRARFTLSSNIIPYSGIGFVFSTNDPYCFIDLDDPTGDAAIVDRQLKVSKEFDSYAEISPSGKGLHIIIKGSIPQGRRRSNIEIYSNQRYATMTGQVYNPKPIQDYQDKLTMLFEQMGSGPATFVYNGNEIEKNDDKTILDIAARASNGDKFVRLLSGNWQDLYPSQSEADLSFIDILAFYTKNRNQIVRIFRQSPLGARKKAKRDDYINRMIDRSFDHMLPPVDIDGFKILSEKFASDAISNRPVAQRLEPSAHNGLVASSNLAGPTTTTAVSFNGRTAPFDGADIGSSPIAASKFQLTPPPGLMGAIAQFIYESSPRQVPETAIAASIGLMAGICGRAYNVSGTGLNQYIILVGNTGVGKESMASGIDKLMKAIKFTVPSSINFIGPAHISSGQALVKFISQNSCFVSIIGEFAFRLQAICDPRASGHEKALYQVLLDLYNKSGFHQDFRGSIYADKDKNIGTTQAPSFSLLAESTPETFYSVINEDMVSTGLMPRFSIVECKSKVPYLNKNAQYVEPPLHLIDQFSSLVAQCEQIMHAKRVIAIPMDEEASKLFDAFEKLATDKTNAVEVSFLRHLWNRAHLKAMKIAALIAVGINPIEPLITTQHIDDRVVHNPAQWAIDLVMNDIQLLSSRFEQGEVGNNSLELKQLERTRYILKEYLNLTHEKAETYKVPPVLFVDKIVPQSFLSRRLASHSAFQNDKMGSTIALKRAIQSLMDADIIREIPTTQMIEKYGTRQKAYVISNIKALGD